MSEHFREQLDYFAAISHAERADWQIEDEFVRSHEHRTLAPFLRALRAERRGDAPLRVLESGCGQGVNLVHLRQMGLGEADAELVGIDPSAESVAEATRRGLDARVANGLELPFEDGAFDAAFCRDVLHHLADDRDRHRFRDELDRVTRPGGLIAAIEPSVTNVMMLGLSLVVEAEKGLREIPEGRILSLFPGADVSRVAPSAAWRLWYHYSSPLRRSPLAAEATKLALGAWEAVSARLTPTALWSYRVYVWRKPGGPRA